MKVRGQIKFRETGHCYEWVKPLSSRWVDDEFEGKKWPATAKSFESAKRRAECEARWSLRWPDK